MSGPHLLIIHFPYIVVVLHHSVTTVSGPEICCECQTERGWLLALGTEMSGLQNACLVVDTKG